MNKKMSSWIIIGSLSLIGFIRLGHIKIYLKDTPEINKSFSLWDILQHRTEGGSGILTLIKTKMEFYL